MQDKRETMTVKSDWMEILRERKTERGIPIKRSLEDLFKFANKNRNLWF